MACNFISFSYLPVCHAELNAVLNKNSSDVKNCTIFVALFPCNECAKVLIQSGIKEVVYYSDKYSDKPEFKAAKRMFDLSGLTYRSVNMQILTLTTNCGETQMSWAKQYSSSMHQDIGCKMTITK